MIVRYVNWRHPRGGVGKGTGSKWRPRRCAHCSEPATWTADRISRGAKRMPVALCDEHHDHVETTYNRKAT